MFVKPAVISEENHPSLFVELAEADRGKALVQTRHPNKPARFLKPEGEEVPEIAFWHRRLRDGDVVLAGKPAQS